MSATRPTAPRGGSCTRRTCSRKTGSDGASAAECGLGTLSRAKAHGTIILCDRGTNLFVNKLAEVKRVHAAGVIIGDVDQPDVVPLSSPLPSVSVHKAGRATILVLPQAQGAGAGALVAGNATGHKSAPVPEVADFSSRGPAQIGADVLKPDVAAPGVSVLAAVAPRRTAACTSTSTTGRRWRRRTSRDWPPGSSGSTPSCDPDVLRSMFMTTAHDTVHAERSQGTRTRSPRAPVRSVPLRLGDPGLVFPAGLRTGWPGSRDRASAPARASGIRATSTSTRRRSGLVPGVVVIVTRKVKNISGHSETYRASYAGGSHLRVSFGKKGSFHKRLRFAIGAGKTRTIKIRILSHGGLNSLRVQGFVSLTSKQHKVRVPVVAKPLALSVTPRCPAPTPPGPSHITGKAGSNGTVSATVQGLVGSTPAPGTVQGDGGRLANADVTSFTVPAGTRVSRIDLDAGAGSNDLDLYLFADDGTPFDPNTDPLVALSASGSASERLIGSIPAGDYWVVVDGFDVASGGGDYDADHLERAEPATAGTSLLAPASQPVSKGETLQHHRLLLRTEREQGVLRAGHQHPGLAVGDDLRHHPTLSQRVTEAFSGLGDPGPRRPSARPLDRRHPGRHRGATTLVSALGAASSVDERDVATTCQPARSPTDTGVDPQAERPGLEAQARRPDLVRRGRPRQRGPGDGAADRPHDRRRRHRRPDGAAVAVAAAARRASRVAVFGFAYLRRYRGGRSALGVQYDLRNAMHDHLLTLDQRDPVDLMPTGQLVARANTRHRAGPGPAQLPAADDRQPAADAAVAGHHVRALAAAGPASAWSIAPALFVVSYRMRLRVFPATWDGQQREGEVAEIVDEDVNGVRVVKAFGQEERELRRMVGVVADAVRRRGCAPPGSRRATSRCSRRSRRSPRSRCSRSAAGWRCTDQITLGTFLAFSTYVAQFVAPARQLAGVLTIGQQARAGVERIFQLLDLEPAIADAPDAVDLPELRGRDRASTTCTSATTTSSRCCDGLRPPRRAPANASPSSARAAAASRRSPRLVHRLLRPGRRARCSSTATTCATCTLHSLRRQVGVGVRGELPVLRHDRAPTSPTAGPTPPDEEVEAAARRRRRRRLHPRAARRLRHAWSASAGSRLSGGQRQRIALARAILADPRILRARRRHQRRRRAAPRRRSSRRLREVLAGRTTLIVAHRVSTLHLADRVVAPRAAAASPTRAPTTS